MNEDIKKVIGLNCLCQAVIHTIDSLHGQPVMMQEFKRDTNNYLKKLDKFIKPMDKVMDLDESDYHVKIVSAIENLISDIEVESIE